MRTAALPLISDYPAYHAEHRPQTLAVVDGSLQLSWQEFNDLVDRCAASMYALGVRHGDRVATISVPGLTYLVTFMATARLGGIWQGVNPRQTRSELEFLLSDSQPTLVISLPDYASRDLLDDLAAISGSINSIKAIIPCQQSAIEELFQFAQCDGDSESAMVTQHVDPEQPCLVVYTSGSTGRPKGALLSHKSIVASARIQSEHWWAEPFRILNNLPINHIGGAVQITCHGIVAGGTNVLMSLFDPDELISTVVDAEVTLIHQVPMMYQKIVESAAFREHGFAGVQTLIWSGGAAPVQLVAQLREAGPSLHTSYGCTESGGEVLYMPEGASDELMANFVGCAPEGIECRIDSETREIQVKADTVMLGYLNNLTATEACFTDDGWLKTGDCGEIDPVTGYWRITDRIKEMYKSGGYNVYPREVEVALESHPEIAMAAVIGIKDSLYGERGVAYLLMEKNYSCTEEEIRAYCRERLTNYKVPKELHCMQELPMLPIGKIDKSALKAIARED